ncbi:MAG: universal stress protein [Cuspidothrix sp.]
MLNTVLVALDGSDITERVIQTLENLLLSSDSQIILCHVIPTSEEEPQKSADVPQSNSSRVSYLQFEKQLQAYQSRLLFKSELEVVSGDPAEEIICLANIYKAELIVIGSRGLTGMKRIVKGSVSSQVMEEANCSVLVVKPKIGDR